MLDLVISVRVFLGRFDMRTMQVGGGRRPGVGSAAARSQQALQCREGQPYSAAVGCCIASCGVGPLAPPQPPPAPQAAIGPRPAGPNCPPTGGDGFTFEHLADREEAWFDFVADTGDGGDPTYA